MRTDLILGLYFFNCCYCITPNTYLPPGSFWVGKNSSQPNFWKWSPKTVIATSIIPYSILIFMLILNKLLRPQKSEYLPPKWNDIDDECQHSPLISPWTITSENENLTVVITCLKWIINYDFWIRVTAHPKGNSSISKQIDLSMHNPLLLSLSEALDDYEDFREAHLNSYQLHILGELLDSLFCGYNPHNGQYSSCLSWSSHWQIFWHKSRSGRRIFYPIDRTKNQLCSWRRTCRCWWTGEPHFQEESAVFFLTPRTSLWVVREQY